MVQVPTDVTAALRAQWLAELSEALQQAQQLLWRLDSPGNRDADLLDLSEQIESARAQALLLAAGRARNATANKSPEWINPWQSWIEDRG